MQGVDAAEHFDAEAKRLFDCENGRRSLPAVQGLLIMFTYSTVMGKDRAGMMFRHTAYRMLDQLDLEENFRNVTNLRYNHKEQKAFSRALWGIYCFER
jgi:predicted fused transcriptional regulator/phosphomethylpyrimidine kinase